MKTETLVYFEVTTDDLEERFEERFDREPTDEELKTILEELGDLATVLGLDYLSGDIMEAFDEAIDSLGLEEN